MCIRDSDYGAIVCALGCAAICGPWMPAAYVHGDPVAQGQCCLLYTSDAADDLLCVDLGGRRIIKKKIQQ